MSEKLVNRRSIVIAEVAGAAYPKGREAAALTHAVEIEGWTLKRVLCNRVKLEHILDDRVLFDKKPLTCPKCKRALGAS